MYKIGTEAEQVQVEVLSRSVVEHSECTRRDRLK